MTATPMVSTGRRNGAALIQPELHHALLSIGIFPIELPY
jgi:hypothetical protein